MSALARWVNNLFDNRLVIPLVVIAAWFWPQIRIFQVFGWNTVRYYIEVYEWQQWMRLTGPLFAAGSLIRWRHLGTRQRAMITVGGAVAGWVPWLYQAFSYHMFSFTYLSSPAKWQLWIYLALAVLAIVPLVSGIAPSPLSTPTPSPIGPPAAGPAPWSDEEMIRYVAPITLTLGLIAVLFVSNASFPGTPMLHKSFRDLLTETGYHHDWTQWLSLIAISATIVLAVKLPTDRRGKAKAVLVLGPSLALIYPVDLWAAWAEHWGSWTTTVHYAGWGIRFYVAALLAVICVALVTIAQPE